MSNPKEHSCCTCGYVWKHGEHGGHNCSDKLLQKIEALEIENAYLEKKRKAGFSYVNIVSSAKECKGWLNLFYGEYCIALVRDVEFADMLRKDLPEKKTLSLEEIRKSNDIKLDEIYK